MNTFSDLRDSNSRVGDPVPAAPSTRGRARQVAMPPAVRALSTLSHVDYEDAFIVDVGPGRARTGEEWARAILEEAPASTRRALRSGWLALGLRLGATRSDRTVLGWQVRRSTGDFALLGAGSRLGLEGEVFVKHRQRTLLAGTFVQLKNPIARAVWAGVAPGHRQVVRHVLDQAGRRIREKERAG